MIITKTQLTNSGACKEQVELFESLFGESVAVTEQLCVRHAQDFDWTFAAVRLLWGEHGESVYGQYAKEVAPAFSQYSVAPCKRVLKVAQARAFGHIAERL